MGTSEVLRPEHLAAASPRTILVRILNNLKTVYLSRGENSRALLTLDRIVSLTPDSPAALRDRGMMAAKLGVVQAARADLSRFLELSPRADDAAMVRARLASLTAQNLN
jgi:regulator of sirC expression with transglutaminase-like and TPR domain